MSSFFRKAISLFVILDEENPPAKQVQEKTAEQEQPASEKNASKPKAAPEPAPMSDADLSKFEKHFERLFEQANLPGPDYFEFWKTMDTLEAHIANEDARMKAVFASLKIQGLSKQILIESAGKYKETILQDKANFESAVQKKSEAEIAGRKDLIQKLQQEHETKIQQIEQLKKEIEAAIQQIDSLSQEIAGEQGKIEAAQRGYLAACSAMVSKIDNDVERFHQIID